MIFLGVRSCCPKILSHVSCSMILLSMMLGFFPKAWGNLGAVHMHEGNWGGASAAFSEGLKHMPTNWRMWENHAEALLRLRR